MQYSAYNNPYGLLYYGCESSAASLDSNCVIISAQHVKPKVKATKRPLMEGNLLDLKPLSSCPSSEMYTSKNNPLFHF